MSEVLKAIEARFKLQLPSLYRQFVLDGWTDHQSANYLWLYTAEWLTPEAIANYEPEEYHNPGYVPFAFNGGGDHYMWHPGRTSTGGLTVLFCPHDDSIASVYAPNFEGFVLRTILEFAAREYTDYGDDKARKQIHDWYVRLAPSVPEQWASVIHGLVDRPAVKARITSPNGSHSWDWEGLISEEDISSTLEDLFRFSELDTEFSWMTE